MTLEDAGLRCLVAHYAEDGVKEAQCIKCKHCRKWIRPRDMGNECPDTVPSVPQDTDGNGDVKGET